jgi:hypothetical protein
VVEALSSIPNTLNKNLGHPGFGIRLRWKPTPFGFLASQGS